MKLIPLDAVLAEIEKLKDKAIDLEDKSRWFLSAALKNRIKFLEVKEVDLEKEIKEEYLERRHYGGRFNMLIILNESQFNDVAKHFFSLGLNASNPLTWEDIANINDIVSEILKECDDNILYDTKEYFCKEVLKRFKAQKGE